MPGTRVSSVDVPLTADGTSSGEVTVEDVSPFAVGAGVVLRGTTVAKAPYRIVSINPATHVIGLKPLLAGVPTEEDLAAAVPTVASYTTADSARIKQAEQFIHGPETSPPPEGNEP